MIETIYFDMDGVLCDFDYQSQLYDIWKPEHKPDWKKVAQLCPDFFAKMPPIFNGLNLLKAVQYLEPQYHFQTKILSAIGIPNGKLGKRIWLKNNTSIKPENVILLDNGKFKHLHATSNSLLIDDNINNVNNFIQAGFKAIQFDKSKPVKFYLDKILELL